MLGVKPGWNRSNFTEALASDNFKNLFSVRPVNKGDFINITPGTVHGTLEGSILLYEVQQNSDVTYRIYDYDRLDAKGMHRQLHTGKALDVIDFAAPGSISHASSRQFTFSEGKRTCVLADNDHYRIDEIFSDSETALENIDSFRILTVISGRGCIVYNNREYRLSAGESWFIAAVLDRVSLIGDLHILCATGSRQNLISSYAIKTT